MSRHVREEASGPDPFNAQASITAITVVYNLEMLYHYSTAAGFEGIVRSSELWATNFSFLNDTSEVDYGVRVVADTLAKFIPSTHGQESEFLEDAAAKFPGERERTDIYVACLSAARDDLSQWRGYGTSNSDRFAIGFDPQRLHLRPKPAPRFATNYFMAQVLYKQVDQEAAVIEHVHNALKRRAASTEPAMTATRLAFELLDLATRFKDAAFAHEQEWRYVFANVSGVEPTVEFMTQAGQLRPYVALQMPDHAKLPIAEVLVLPHGRPAQALKATQLALERHAYDRNLAAISRIPFLG